MLNSDNFMKHIILQALAVSLSMLLSASASAQSGTSELRRAIALYESAQYESASSILSKLEASPLSEGYIVLCAIASRKADFEERISAYERAYPGSILTDRIRFEQARVLFDSGRYDEAALLFSKISSAILNEAETQEYLFKCGYCAFSLERLDQAESFLSILDALDYCEYSSPARYIRATMLYNSEQFAQAEKLYWQLTKDPRFADLACFYIIDCEFNQGNYDYAISEGEKIYESATPERKTRLARIISEASLIRGDKQKAREYFDGLSAYEMNRKDYFYAGTVMYSVGDYPAAIHNYTQMGELRDSLGQIAAYHLGNSYLKTHNSVAAMDAFKVASELNYDKKMTEDASFNYAKLAFDLNKDSSGFNNYLRRYSTKTRGEQIYGYMALAALIDRDYAAAIEAYDHIDELDNDMLSNYCKANFLRAQQLFAGASYTDAIPYWRVCAYYLPKTSRLSQYSRYWIAEAQYRIGEYSEAAASFTELYNSSALYGSTEGALLPYNVGYSHFKAGDYSPAARWFELYLSSGAGEHREDALCRRADCDFAQANYGQAVSSYQRVLDEYDSADRIYPYYQQAISYGLAGDKAKKISTLKRVEAASKDAPLYEEAWYELGRAQMDGKKSADAIASFRHLKDNAKDKVWKAKALAGLGMVYRNANDYSRSLESYKSIVSLLPGSQYAEEALLAIESIYQKQKQGHKFLEYLEANSLSESRTEAEKEQIYFNTAEQLYLDGSYSEAIAALSKFLDSYPGSSQKPLTQFYLAESYRASGDKEKSVSLYAQAKSASSEQAFTETAKLRFAELSFELERFQDAYQGYLELNTSTKLNANRSLAAVGMMRSAYKCKDYPAAINASDLVVSDSESSAQLLREAKYTKAKASLALSRRKEALALFRELAADPSSTEGAEAMLFIIQNSFDTGDFATVESQVYSFSQKAGDQSYYLAKAYLILGDSFAQRGQIEQARATYESIRDGYVPESGSDDVADNVRKRIDNLNSIQAN